MWIWKKVPGWPFAMILGVSLLSAQVQVREEPVPMSMGDRNAFSVVLEDVEDKLVEASWKDFMGKYGKTIMSKGEWVTKKVAINSIGGSGFLKVFAKTKQTGDNVTLSVWFDLGGTFLASSLEPEKFAAAGEFLKEFSIKVSEDSASAKLDAAQTILKELESTLNKLQVKFRSYEDDIQKAEKSLAKVRQKMQDNLSEQTDLQEKIRNQVLAVRKAEQPLKDKDQ